MDGLQHIEELGNREEEQRQQRQFSLAAAHHGQPAVREGTESAMWREEQPAAVNNDETMDWDFGMYLVRESKTYTAVSRPARKGPLPKRACQPLHAAAAGGHGRPVAKELHRPLHPPDNLVSSRHPLLDGTAQLVHAVDEGDDALGVVQVRRELYSLPREGRRQAQ